MTAAALAAASLRTAHLLHQARALPFLSHPILDAALYHEWARAMASGAVTAAGPFYHAPGYALVLASVYGVFGSSLMAAVLFQALLGVVTTVLTMLLARRLFGTHEAVVAGLVMLFMGPLYFFEAKLLATSLAVFLSVLTVYLTVLAKAHEGQRRRMAWAVLALAGMSAGMLAVVRANLLLLPVFVLAAFTFRAVRGRAAWGSVVLYGASVLIALLPTLAHNLSHDTLAPVATNGGFNFYAGNVRGATGVYTDVPGVSGVIRNQEAEADSLVFADAGRALSPAEESRYWFRRGLDEIAADPAGWLKLLGRKTLLLVNRQNETVNGSYAVESDRIAVLRMAVVPFNVLAALALVGLALALGWFGTRPGSRGPLTSAGALLLAVAVSGIVFFAMTRLRLPAAPVLAVLAGHALVRGWGDWRHGSRLAVLSVAGGVILFSALTWNSPLGAARNPGWEAKLFVEAAKALDQSGDEAKAADAYRMARELNPTSLDALRGEAELAMKARDFPRAIEAMEQAATVVPDDFSVHNNLGILYMAAGRLDDCLRTMATATELDPDAGSPYLYRGHALRQRDDPQAAAAFEAALERDPRLRGAYVALIELSLDGGDIQNARSWAARATDNNVQLPPELLSRLR